MTHKRTPKRKTWLNLYDFFATNHHIPIDFWYDKDQPGGPYHNSHFEPITNRRFNQVSKDRRDPSKVRLVFLRSLLDVQPKYKRLCHKDGRPVWAYNLKYEGTSTDHHRLLSFSLAGEAKVFTISEKDVLFLEDDQFINPNHHFFMLSHRLAFSCFGNPFVAERCLNIMHENEDSDETKEDFLSRVAADSDVKVGSLVEVRMGLFAPDFKYRKTLLATMAEKYCQSQQLDARHPSRTNLFKYLKGASAFQGITENQEPAYIEFINWCRESSECDFPLGLVLRKDTIPQHFFSNGKETFTVKFGDLVYEDIHPIQLEVVKNKNV